MTILNLTTFLTLVSLVTCTSTFAPSCRTLLCSLAAGMSIETAPLWNATSLKVGMKCGCPLPTRPSTSSWVRLSPLVYLGLMAMILVLLGALLLESLLLGLSFVEVSSLESEVFDTSGCCVGVGVARIVGSVGVGRGAALVAALFVARIVGMVVLFRVAGRVALFSIAGFVVFFRVAGPGALSRTVGPVTFFRVVGPVVLFGTARLVVVVRGVPLRVEILVVRGFVARTAVLCMENLDIRGTLVDVVGFVLGCIEFRFARLVFGRIVDGVARFVVGGVVVRFVLG